MGSPRRSISDRPASSVGGQAGERSEDTGLLVPEFEPKTQGELFLWKAWKQAENRIKQLEATIKVLQQNITPKQLNYETDEDELERETASNIQRSGVRNKKRKANSSPETSPKQDDMLPDTNNNNNNNKKVKMYTPPPIFVSEVNNFNLLKATILQNVKHETNFKTLANGKIKINTAESDDFRNIIHLLNSIKSQEKHLLYGIAYHTYQCKQERPYKVVIRGLHSTTNVVDIKEEFARLGHEAIRITNVIIKKRINGVQNKIAFPLFYIDLAPKTNNKDVYNITQLLYCKIKIEPPRIKKEIPQCKNCQGFRHTQNYCQRKAKCVKCDGKHHPSECRKSKNMACKCANCGGDHTANWKECQIYKDKLAVILKPKMTVTQRVQQITRTPANIVSPSKTFAEAAVGKRVQVPTSLTASKPESSGPSIHDIWNLLHSIQQMLTNTERRLDSLEQGNKQKPNSIVKKEKK